MNPGYNGFHFIQENYEVFFLNELKNEVDTIIKKYDDILNAKQCLMLPMNLKNNLTNPNNIFIPDPWTDTKVQCDNGLGNFYKIIKKIILNNKNVQLNIKEYLYFFKYVLLNTTLNFKFFFFKNFLNLISKKYFKAILFDRLITDLFYKKISSDRFDVSSIFLNAGAHIQHHYMFNSSFIKKKNNPNWYLNSKHDPIKDYLLEYDKILGKLLSLKNNNILIMTGLSQSVIEKPIYYYNLKNYENFFSKLEIYPKNIVKRMSRDYTLEFDDLNLMNSSLQTLNNLKLNDKKFFQCKSEKNKIFLELIYSDELKENDKLFVNDRGFYIKEELVFLAIKNTIHNQKGYCFTNLKFLPDKVNIKDFYDFLTNEKFVNET